MLLCIFRGILFATSLGLFFVVSLKDGKSLCNLTAEKVKVVAGSEHLEISFYEIFQIGHRSELTFPTSFEDIPLFDVWDRSIQ